MTKEMHSVINFYLYTDPFGVMCLLFQMLFDSMYFSMYVFSMYTHSYTIVVVVPSELVGLLITLNVVRSIVKGSMTRDDGQVVFFS